MHSVCWERHSKFYEFNVELLQMRPGQISHKIFSLKNQQENDIKFRCIPVQFLTTLTICLHLSSASGYFEWCSARSQTLSKTTMLYHPAGARHSVNSTRLVQRIRLTTVMQKSFQTIAQQLIAIIGFPWRCSSSPGCIIKC